MEASVRRCRLLALGPISIMQCSSEQQQRTLASVMVVTNYLLSLCNGLSRRSRSADVVCNSVQPAQQVIGSSGHDKEPARERETCEGRGRPLLCLLLADLFFLAPTTSKCLLRRLSNVIREIRRTTRKVFFHFGPLALPTEKPPHEIQSRQYPNRHWCLAFGA